MNPIITLAMAPAPGSTATPASPQSVVFMWVWLFIWIIPIAGICYATAKQKGRNAAGTALLCLIPFLNIFVLLYIALASNKHIEKKLNDILAALNSTPKDNQ